MDLLSAKTNAASPPLTDFTSALAEFIAALEYAFRIAFFHVPCRLADLRTKCSSKQRWLALVCGLCCCAIYIVWLLLPASSSTVPPLPKPQSPVVDSVDPLHALSLPPFPRIPKHAALSAKSAHDKAAYGSIDRKLVESYVPKRLHVQLFDELAGPQEEWFDAEFTKAMRFLYHALEFPAAGGNSTEAKQAAATAKIALKRLLKPEAPGVYSFPMFKGTFCDLFLAELDNYYSTGLPTPRPNSMNNYGIIVNQIGMAPMITVIQQMFLQPLAVQLFPEQASQFDQHHSFMVKYRQGEDLGLDMHTDDSDVTVNICLGKNFTGAGLTFCGRVGESEHRQFLHSYKVLN
jgi:hypothetical protein